MRRKIHATIVVIVGILALIALFATPIYVAFNGLSGDGSNEVGVAIVSFFTFLWCGLRFNDILHPEETEDVPTFLSKWTPF